MAERGNLRRRLGRGGKGLIVNQKFDSERASGEDSGAPAEPLARVAEGLGPADGPVVGERPPGGVPLVLDLDGTLIQTDLLAETTLLYLKRAPWRVFWLLAWLAKGKAHLKRRLALAAPPDLLLLPARASVVAFAEAESRLRPVYLATASDADLAAPMAQRFAFLSGVMGSDGHANLKGAQKAQALKARFPGGFDYVGDSGADLAIWRMCRTPIYGGDRPSVARRLKHDRPDAVILPIARPTLKIWVKALRLHQWSKNGLLLVPLVLGGEARDPRAWLLALAGFLAMGLLASATYLLNDLLDLQEDRAHWSKKTRAFASGQLPLGLGVALIPLGLAFAFALGWTAGGPPGAGGLFAYLCLTLLYSFRLKRAPIVDAMTLGGLFTLRLAIGVLFARVAWSSWLMVFSMFLFTSLSFAKRATELERAIQKGATAPSGRGYVPRDQPLVLALGVSLTAAAVLVLVMYLIEEAFETNFYRSPQFLWVFPVVLALWLGRIWLLCGRGELNDDPVAFAVRDKISIGLGAVLALALACALI
jgi:4-hydroxybenzoate polyprenyltransferase/phosphoserine phosphatase